jgi:hypothetical protein
LKSCSSHELAHIRRADYLWNLLQTLVETLFFFHPAVWWVSRRVREERELCCDDIAVEEACSDPTVYASALLRLEEERRTRLHLAMALDGHQSRAGLRARILRILGDREATPRSFRPISLAGVAIALVLFLCPLPKALRQLPRHSACRRQHRSNDESRHPDRCLPRHAHPASGLVVHAEAERSASGTRTLRRRSAELRTHTQPRAPGHFRSHRLHRRDESGRL